MKIAFFSTKAYDKASFNENNHGAHRQEITYFETILNEKTAKLAKGFDAVCVFVNDHLDAEVIRLLSEYGVRLIALRCAGFNNVDLNAAVEYGIKVVRVPAYSPEAIAEHAVALILTLNRKTNKAYNRVRDNNFSLEGLLGFDLHGKTVGVIGTGKIGVAFCKIMKGFGCRVLANDLYPSKSVTELDIPYVPFEELLEQSDIISLHCPLTEETYHMFDQAVFDRMKKGMMLINTSRGGLINTEDSIEALKKRQLAYLGIDVYEQEENLFFRDLSERINTDDTISRLMTFPNVLITAHQGFFTKEALEQIANTTLRNVSAFEHNNPIVNQVLPV